MNQEINEDEVRIILEMRKFGPFASFRIEKRPTKNIPTGELVKITTEIRKIMRTVNDPLIFA